ncbi:MAG: TaqI-like C-terminal specificity domain-containing protein [Patescibacteria group bacterium]
MGTNIDLDEFLPTMDAPDKVYQLFESLGFKVLDSHLKTNPSVYNLPVKEAALVEKIYAVSNYDRRFQILLFKLKEENKEAIRTIPEKILREVDFPFIIFTPDFKTYTFTLVEKVREGPGEFKRKLTKLVVDSSQPYHTDKEILGSLALSVDTKNPVEVYKMFQSAFSVEKVTKKFFTEYREVFERLVGEVTKQNKHLKFTLFSRDASVENFVKILLGRLMFLYFIQKRGWLNCFDGWGSGDKKFLYNKFQEAKKEKKNYFKDYLEPLFFDTLNNPRRDKPDQATQFGGRIPFLNGGLFEPEYDYQDVRNHILLENSTFDDVFSVFEKYNFTVKEDEPLEKEVAIDPEMLGKVFENLLEENLRKGKGTYYTPREIVHYMCHESLINYLASEVSLDQDVIRNFLDREQSLEKKETLSSAIREKAKEIDEKLADIKVLDPACGSGAFLVGMLHEVINARLSLNRELGRSLSEYEVKKATIQNNIYGVDIDPGASEIAKLRLWLTLVVDHNLSEIEPLPNLDYKIMVGNSLLDEFMGVKLFNPENAKAQANGKKMISLFDEDSQVSLFENDDKKTSVLKALQGLHALYFKESDPEKKKQIRTQIDKIEFDLIEATVNDEVSQLERKTKGIVEPYLSHGIGIPAKEAERISKLSSQQGQILETFNEIKKSNVKPFFLFQLHFSDVFEKKGGFDIVIANPPYMKERDNKKVFEIVNNSSFGKKYHQGKMDYWYYFLHKAIDITKDNGFISYITSRYWINSYGAKKLIERVNKELSFVNFVDIGKLKVFDEVAGYHMIAVYKKTVDIDLFTYKKLQNEISDISKSSNTENLEIKTLSKKEIFTDNDEIILETDGLKYDNVVLLGSIADTSVGVQESPDKINSKLLLSAKRTDISVGDGVFVLSQKELDNLRLKEIGRLPIIKKYLDPNDVYRYRVSWKSKYLIYSDNKIKEDIKSNKEYISIKNHLDKFREFISSSNKPYGLHRSRDIKYFIEPKIIFKNMFIMPDFTYDDKGYFFGFSFSSIIQKDKTFDLKYILGILNSKVAFNWFQKNGKRRGAGFDIGVEKLRLFPIKKITLQEQKPIIEIVDKLLDITKDGDYLQNPTRQTQVKDYEKQIDQLVYKLYGLTPEEILVVEDQK